MRHLLNIIFNKNNGYKTTKYVTKFEQNKTKFGRQYSVARANDDRDYDDRFGGCCALEREIRPCPPDTLLF